MGGKVIILCSTLYIFLRIIYRTYTGTLGKDFTAHGYCHREGQQLSLLDASAVVDAYAWTLKSF